MAASVAGIDWARRGWVAVVLRESGAVEVLAGPDIAALVARVPEVAVVAVDMPIGLPSGTRGADADARSFVGARRSSVFMTPPQEVLRAIDYREANEIARRRTGKGISQIELPDELGEGGDVAVAVADVLDAAAAGWSARRCADGTAKSFPAGARLGQREVIWY